MRKLDTIEEVKRQLFIYDPQAHGVKGLVLMGDKLLVYRRDGHTDSYPYYIDVPGGGVEEGETPFETFSRECREEFGIHLQPANIVHVAYYPNETVSFEGKDVVNPEYFPVAQLPVHDLVRIRFGDEGVKYMLMTPDEFLSRDDVMPVFQARVRDYLAAT